MTYIRKPESICYTCGMPTRELRKILFFCKINPFTIQGRQHRGRCLHCHPLNNKPKHQGLTLDDARHLHDYAIHDPEVSRIIIRIFSNNIQNVIRNMTNHLNDALMQEEGCCDLWQLSKTPSLCETIANAGGINAIIASMKAHPDTATLQAEACAAIFALAKSSGIVVRIHRAGAIPVILKAMKRHSCSKDVQKEAHAVLFTLVTSRHGFGQYSSNSSRLEHHS